MIKYLYTSNYDHAAGDNQNTESEPALCVHANVYGLAGKYEITILKVLALQKYIDALSIEGDGSVH